MQQSPGRRRLLPPAHPALVREERRGLRRRAADQQPRCGAGRTGRCTAASPPPSPRSRPDPPKRCPRRADTSMGVGGVAPAACKTPWKAASKKRPSSKNVKQRDESLPTLENAATHATFGLDY